LTKHAFLTMFLGITLCGGLDTYTKIFGQTIEVAFVDLDAFID